MMEKRGREGVYMEGGGLHRGEGRRGGLHDGGGRGYT